MNALKVCARIQSCDHRAKVLTSASAQPPSLKALPKLSTLELIENSFQSLPEEIVTFPHLASANLSNNEFLVWPDPISYCTVLTELEFRHNAMKEIQQLKDKLETKETAVNQLE